MISTINNCIKKRKNVFLNMKTWKILKNQLLEEINNCAIDLISDNTKSELLETIYIAIDGVPTMAKIAEQKKKRRYMGSVISTLNKKPENDFSWSKNNISPGTSFIKIYKKTFIQKN